MPSVGIEMRGVVIGLLFASGCVGPDLDGDGWSALLDCNDDNSGIHPTSLEVCDGVDNDCDGLIDLGAIDAFPAYPDEDGDGAGDPLGKVFTCQPAKGTVDNGDDCDDTNRAINPAGTEFCNGVDDDCDHLVDEDALAQRPYYLDADFDGHGDPTMVQSACVPPPNSVTLPDDCDDHDPLVHPGVPELCNLVDDDCDGAVDDAPVDGTAYSPDVDGDGYGWLGATVTACETPAGWVVGGTDCDDFDPANHPGADERCDGVDNDCDALVDDASAVDPSDWYLDGDGDGFGAGVPEVGCAADAGYVALAGDCDDAVATVNPFAPEICANLVDDDCNGLVDECP